MAGNQVELVLAGDSKSLERAFDRAGQSALDAAGDFDKASADAKGFGSAMDRAGEAAGNSESKFMGTADLLDGLGGAFGLPTDKATGLFRAFGDLSGGFEAVQPLFTGILSKLGLMTGATAAQAAATEGATVAQGGLNAAFSANPIGAVVLAIGALIAAGVLIVKNWDTIKSAFSTTWGWISDRFSDLVGFVQGLPKAFASAAGAITDALTGPFKSAFNGIADLWNHTVGALSFKTPDWVPVIGGKGWDFPDMPKFHDGGPVAPALAQGTPIAAMLLAGEEVNPIGRTGGGGGVTVHVHVAGSVIAERDLGRVVADALRKNRLLGVTV